MAAIMLQGTGSDVGKSLLVAGLCRAWTRQGLAVRPFKPQNMSNNAAVTPQGAEIGRAQALQAIACGVAAEPDMNPVLLKPQSEVGAQVVVRGRVRGRYDARAYQRLKPALLEEVLGSFRRLERGADVVVVEGAGSAAELNLRAGDIANMGFARAAGVPVVLVGDIHRGGVIASLYGTWALLPAAERALLAGYLVNKFRGDKTLFESGTRIIGEHTGLPCLGVVPWFEDAGHLPAEDAMNVPAHRGGIAGTGTIKVAVPRLARIANFDDLDPLRAEPDVEVVFVPPGEALPGDADLVVLPGTKATRADLDQLRAQGWDVDLVAHLRRGGRVLGICGGYQMLGREVRDEGGVEGPPGTSPGLGLLPIVTELAGEKILTVARGVDPTSGAPVHGYRMHVGRSRQVSAAAPMLTLEGAPHGAVSADGRVMGCYLHGLFAGDEFRAAFLARIRARTGTALAYEALVEDTLDRLADHLEAHADLPALLAASGHQGTATTATSAASVPAAAR